jgi:hypothetical protein
MAARPYVFGIGLSRTGTRSLASALDVIGWRAIHFPHDRRTFEQLRSGDFRLDILERFDAITDTPVVPYFAQLDALYPGSRFVLTIRDLPTWLARTEAFWKRTHKAQMNAFHRFVNTAVYGTWLYERARFDYVYRRHFAAVEAHFAGREQSLLVLDICGGDGWEKLCGFLGCPIPDSPFPHKNRSGASVGEHAAR